MASVFKFHNGNEPSQEMVQSIRISLLTEDCHTATENNGSFNPTNKASVGGGGTTAVTSAAEWAKWGVALVLSLAIATTVIYFVHKKSVSLESGVGSSSEMTGVHNAIQTTSSQMTTITTVTPPDTVATVTTNNTEVTNATSSTTPTSFTNATTVTISTPLTIANATQSAINSTEATTIDFDAYYNNDDAVDISKQA